MKIENGFLRLEEKEIEKINNKGLKKITGTTFGAILGMNDFEKKGDAMLGIFRLRPRKEIDPFYTKRGYIAEQLIGEYLKASNQMFKTWKPEEINYDNFPKENDFGGMLDFGVAKPIRYVGECKSSNVSRKDNVLNNKSYIYQGKLYSELCKSNKLVMFYVLFTDYEEDLIKQNIFVPNQEQMKKMLDDGRIIMREHNVDFEEIQKLKQQALEYRDECIYFYNYAIPLTDISENVLKELGIQLGGEDLF